MQIETTPFPCEPSIYVHIVWTNQRIICISVSARYIYDHLENMCGEYREPRVPNETSYSLERTRGIKDA